MLRRLVVVRRRVPLPVPPSSCVQFRHHSIRIPCFSVSDEGVICGRRRRRRPPVPCVVEGGGWTVVARHKSSASASASRPEVVVVETNLPEEIQKKTINDDDYDVERRYVRMDPRDHVLLRPGMYVGSVERAMRTDRVVVMGGEGNHHKASIVWKRDLSVVPALLKMFDEILVNAADHRQRCPRCTQIDLSFVTEEEKDNGGGKAVSNTRIVVRNNGSGIPVHFHSSEGCYVPEMLFGRLLTGSNFGTEEEAEEDISINNANAKESNNNNNNSNNNDQSVGGVGGRHGYGAKLTNLFSKEFTVETVDDVRGLKYRQTWKENMADPEPPEITSVMVGKSQTQNKKKGHTSPYTEISFVPDASRLDGGVTEDDRAVMIRRAYDVAACTGLKVTVDGREVGTTEFKTYVEAHRHSRRPGRKKSMGDNKKDTGTDTNDDDDRVRFVHLSDIGWDIGYLPTSSLSSSSGGGGSGSGSAFDHVGFVHGLHTPMGGTHIDAVVSLLVDAVLQKCKNASSSSSLSLSSGGASAMDMATVRPMDVRRRLSTLFVNASRVNPSPIFDSQSKERLAGPSSKILLQSLQKDLLSLSNKKALAVFVEDVSDRVLALVAKDVRGRVRSRMAEAVPKSRAIGRTVPKLDDAHELGPSATMLLTEGDSAKALAVAGLSSLPLSEGRRRHGVFPLRGKFRNVRDHSHGRSAAVTKNAEILNLVGVLGLDFQKTYRTTSERDTLRYGRVIVMADQDADGSHIKGLVLNFFSHFWPALIRPPVDVDANADGNVDVDDTNADDSQHNHNEPYLSAFVTPLVKAVPVGKRKNADIDDNGNGNGNGTLNFYSLGEYEEWRRKEDEKEPSKRRKYKVKYYKGLGTSTPEEAAEYFARMYQDHVVPFDHCSDMDEEALRRTFEKDRSEDRKHWLREWQKTYPEQQEEEEEEERRQRRRRRSISDFVDRELVTFSHHDNVRSLPSVLDGLKPSQRKVLYSCFLRRNLEDEEVKVAQLTGYCAERTAYHHGETSLQSTIVGMAQTFVGSNNLNLLEPVGQFGTRLEGGRDAASARYIYVKLNRLARRLFPEVDDGLLPRLYDDGQPIEPAYYCPVLPMLLVNGAQGIGTGWSTYVPPHHPLHVLDRVRTLLDHEPDHENDHSTHILSPSQSQSPPLVPWVRGFAGSIEAREGSGSSGYISRGMVQCSPDGDRRCLRITELPVGKWTNDYKAWLLSNDELREAGWTLHQESNTTVSVDFVLRNPSVRVVKEWTSWDHHNQQEEDLSLPSSSSLYRRLRLETALNTSNMHAFAAPPVCLSEEDPLHGHVVTKFETPEDILHAYFPTRLGLYDDRRRSQVGTLARRQRTLSNRIRFIDEVLTNERDRLLGSRLSRAETEARLEARGYDREGDDDDETKTVDATSGHTNGNGNGYDYLLRMPISSFTSEQTERLRSEAANVEASLQKLQDTSARRLWHDDLDALEPVLVDTYGDGRC